MEKLLKKLSSRWKSFKYRLKELWYKYILRREYRVGWMIHEEVGIVIINDYAISRVTITGEDDGEDKEDS